MTITADDSTIILLFVIALVFYALRQQKRPALPARARNEVKRVDFRNRTY